MNRGILSGPKKPVQESMPATNQILASLNLGVLVTEWDIINGKTCLDEKAAKTLKWIEDTA